jgi:class 3 adenylate cyclase
MRSVAELPHGTVTFAFTDIEGSTALLKRLGDGYGDVLAAHRRLVRAAFTAFDGVEIDTQGDAFFFAFTRARDAVAAAARVQRDHAEFTWPPGAPVRTRIGLHTGEPTLGEEGYLGLDVVRAARLCGVCDGGHVLLSETTRALIGSKLPSGVSVFPVGERHLKDIDEPERVYELEIEGARLPPMIPDDGLAVPPPSASPRRPPGRRSVRRDRKAERDRQREETRAAYEERAEEFARRTTENILGFIERKLGDLAERTDGAAADIELGDVHVRADELARRARDGIRRAMEERTRTEPDD